MATKKPAPKKPAPTKKPMPKKPANKKAPMVRDMDGDGC